MKRILLLLILTIYCVAGYAAPGCDGTREHPCIVLDASPKLGKINNWRDMAMIAKYYAKLKGNTAGLKDMWVSGSDDPNAHGWKFVRKKIRRATDHQVEHMIDVDLRQDSHGYLNNKSIGLTDSLHVLNQDKTYEEVIAAETAWLDQLRKQAVVKNVLTEKQLKNKEFSAGRDFKVQNIESEEQLVKKKGFDYFRVAVTDHSAPEPIEVDRFLNFVKNLKPHTWLHFHCREGDGRTTTFLAMMDMLHNAGTVSFNDIIERQASALPHYNLLIRQSANDVIASDFEIRKKFITEFYEFAKEYRQGYQGTWSEWLKNHN